MRRRVACTAVALATVAGLLAGCSSSSGGSPTNGSSPSAELISAITKLGQASTVTASLTVTGTPGQLRDVIRQQDPKAKITSRELTMLGAAAITIEVQAPSGQSVADVAGLSSSGGADISVTSRGIDYFSLRFVGGALYIKLDLQTLLNALGQQSIARQFQSAGSQLPPFLQALVNGKWVTLQASTLAALGAQLGGRASSPKAGSQHHLLDQLKTLLTTDVTVSRAHTTSSDQLTLTTNLRTFVGHFSSLLGNVPGVSSALGGSNLSKVPDRDVTLTATITSGVLSSLVLDGWQDTGDSIQGALPLRMTFVQSGTSITPPSGAVAVDLNALGQLLSAFGSGGL